MPTTGFFTDATVCIGCKACEVACKEWNGVPADGFTWTGNSYDNTGGLGHSTWRHVRFVERVEDGLPAWDFASDVCKHCEHAGCLDACPTGSIIRTEFGGVFVQEDVCNGCGYCVVSCPFGVIGRRPDDGRAFKCTFCYDRQKAGLEPACAKACPTESSQFGDHDELRARAVARAADLAARGVDGVAVWDPRQTSVGARRSRRPRPRWVARTRTRPAAASTTAATAPRGSRPGTERSIRSTSETGSRVRRALP